MGPWFIRDEKSPFRPGCSFEVLRALAVKGRLSPETIVRGPATKQFWTSAAQTPGLGHLFGACHSCGTECNPTDVTCDECHASFVIESNRQHLGLGPIHILPGSGMAPPMNPNRLKSLVGDSIDEEQLIAASATTLPREELPEAMAELRTSHTTPRRGDAGVVSSAELQSLEQRLSTSRILVMAAGLVACLAIATTVLVVLDVKQDLGLGLAHRLQGSSKASGPTAAVPADPVVDNLSVPVMTAPTTATETSTPPDESATRPRTRGIAGSPSQPAVLPSTPAPSTVPGPHDKPTPDGEKIPADGTWDDVGVLLKKNDREAILKALTLVEKLELSKVPPPATRPDLGQAVRTKAALMTLTPSTAPTGPSSSK